MMHPRLCELSPDLLMYIEQELEKIGFLHSLSREPRLA
jgi:hypothetical protein